MCDGSVVPSTKGGHVLYDRILTATDGSDLAQRRVEQGLSRARSFGSKVTIIIVTERSPLEGLATDSGWMARPADLRRYDDGQDEFANRILSAAKAEANELGIDAVSVHIPNEHPGTGILRATRSLECNLIVMASHGQRGVSRLLLGS